ncbi:hypothetical protein RND71_019333 [Anisodus tanguticus]|uniref:Uncharacterized protein n=1 Tax=Anisodus tanguticus TaxID=243964 RepID=A0AAE1S0P7_9SOLA|nr:hypothetical protein RND71_019333 [Anisodus tanguticus]
MKHFPFCLPKGSSLPRTALVNPVLDPVASAHRIAQVPKKKKATKPPVSPSVPSKRQKNLEECGPSGVKEATNSGGSMLPPVEQPPVIIQDDEGTDDEVPLKRPRTSTPPPETTNPPPSFGQDEFDHLFGKAETENTVNLVPLVNTSGFSRMPFSQILSSSSRPPRNHSSSRAKLVNVFLAPSVNLNKLWTAIISFPKDTNFLSRFFRVSSILTEEDFRLCIKENDDLKAEKAQSVLRSEHTTWNVWRFTLEQVQDELTYLDEKITEAKVLELKDFRRMKVDSSEEDPKDSDPESDLFEAYSQSNNWLPPAWAIVAMVNTWFQRIHASFKMDIPGEFRNGILFATRMVETRVSNMTLIGEQEIEEIGVGALWPCYVNMVEGLFVHFGKGTV